MSKLLLKIHWKSPVRQRILMVITTPMLALSVALGGLYSHSVSAQSAKPASPLASSLDAGFAVDWIQLVYDRVKADKTDAPGGSRVYAYVGVTLYEAVVPGIPQDVSLSTQINGMPSPPALEQDAVYDWPSVANAALQVVTDSLLISDDTHKATATLRAQQTSAREAVVGTDVVQRSLARGDIIGKAIAGWAATDGATEAYAKAKTYVLPKDNVWDYVPTTPGTVPVGPFWGTVRPFGLESSAVCNIKLHLELSSDPNSTLYKQALEVKTIGDHLTAEQKAIANWWVDTPGLTGGPAGHWMMIASQMVDDVHLKLDRAAEMYGMVGMALGDAFIACWQTKYANPILRPVTYINRYIDPHWQSYIASPPFPSYVSGHSAVSELAALTLTDLLGEVAFTDTTHVKDGQPARSFTSFVMAANEAAMSRMYGGIHFRTDMENGLALGQCLSEHFLNNIHLQATSSSS